MKKYILGLGVLLLTIPFSCFAMKKIRRASSSRRKSAPPLQGQEKTAPMQDFNVLLKQRLKRPVEHFTVDLEQNKLRAVIGAIFEDPEKLNTRPIEAYIIGKLKKTITCREARQQLQENGSETERSFLTIYCNVSKQSKKVKAVISGFKLDNNGKPVFHATPLLRAVLSDKLFSLYASQQKSLKRRNKRTGSSLTDKMLACYDPKKAIFDRSRVIKTVAPKTVAAFAHFYEKVTEQEQKQWDQIFSFDKNDDVVFDENALHALFPTPSTNPNLIRTVLASTGVFLVGFAARIAQKKISRNRSGIVQRLKNAL